MANIPIRDITQTGIPTATSNIVFDDGSMKRATIADLADGVRPVASQSEAQTGSDNSKTMSPLRVKQSIASEVGVTIASKSQGDAANTALQPAAIGSTIQAYDADLASIAGLSPANNDFLQRKSGAWVNRTPAQAKADLSLSTVATSGAYGDLSGLPTLGDLAAKDQAAIADITATGTPSSTTALFGDGTWKTPAGGGDMTKASYDPDNIGADVYDLGNQTGQLDNYVEAASRNATAVYDPSVTYGWFSDYDNKASFFHRLYFTESVVRDPAKNGFTRDGAFIHVLDQDATDYVGDGSNPYRGITNGFQVVVTGPYDPGTTNFLSSTKDLVGIDSHVIGRVNAAGRGVSGIAAGAIQGGSGICDNEFAAQNPSWALEQSISIAGVQAIVRNDKAASDSTHTAYAILATSDSAYKITAIIGGTTTSAGAQYGLYLLNTTVTDAAIRMPANGNGRGIINYDSNDYTNYVAGSDRYDWVIGGAIVASLDAQRLSLVGAAGSATARLSLPASTGALASINLAAGAAPTTPHDGDIWYNGADFYVCVGTKTYRLNSTLV